MLTVDEAKIQVIQHISPLAVVLCPLIDSVGMILAESIISPVNSPPFTNSAMDGYAFSLEDSWNLPLYRTVSHTLPAGKVSQRALQSNEAIRIMTGAPIPEGADTVVPIENTEQIDENRIRIINLKTRGQHIRPVGEDFQTGDVLVHAGQMITPGIIGLLATAGMPEIPVYSRPRVAIISTGNELVGIHETPGPGQIRDSNRYTLAAAVQMAGGIPVLLGVAQDTREDLRQKLVDAFEQADLILTLGGVSVGDYDYVQDVLLELGFQKVFWKVAMKPGKPVLFGTWEGKPIFGLPGNPGSALTVFEQFVRPALRKMMGHVHLWKPVVQATLKADIQHQGDRRHFLRAMVSPSNGGWEVTPLKKQGSANLLIVGQANGLIMADRSYSTNETVPVQLLEYPEVSL